MARAQYLTREEPTDKGCGDIQVDDALLYSSDESSRLTNLLTPSGTDRFTRSNLTDLGTNLINDRRFAYLGFLFKTQQLLDWTLLWPLFRLVILFVALRRLWFELFWFICFGRITHRRFRGDLTSPPHFPTQISTLFCIYSQIIATGRIATIWIRLLQNRIRVCAKYNTIYFNWLWPLYRFCA